MKMETKKEEESCGKTEHFSALCFKTKRCKEQIADIYGIINKVVLWTNNFLGLIFLYQRVHFNIISLLTFNYGTFVNSFIYALIQQKQKYFYRLMHTSF